MTHREDQIAGLREIATFLEQNPDVPVSNNIDVFYCVLEKTDEAGIDTVTAIAKALGVDVTNSYDEAVSDETDHLHAIRSFGPIRYRATYIRQEHMADYNALMSYSGQVSA